MNSLLAKSAYAFLAEYKRTGARNMRPILFQLA